MGLDQYAYARLPEQDSAEAPTGKAHPNFRHGLRTKQMQEIRRLISALGKGSQDVLEGLD